MRIKNIRNTFAREHPLSIFDAILKSVAHIPGRFCPCDVFFHPNTPLGKIIRKGETYELTLVFPSADHAECEKFLENIFIWLENPLNNFTFLAADEIRERSVAILLREYASSFPDEEKTDEVCLEFVTPVSLDQKNKQTREFIDGAGLFRLFSNRLQRFYGKSLHADLLALEETFKSLMVSPWFWEYAEFHHRSKSKQGQQYVCGMMGPLYIRGAWEKILPLLLIGSELHIGGKRGAGQGAYRLVPHRPCLDEKLFDREELRKVWATCEQDTDLPFGPEDKEKDEYLDELCENLVSGRYSCGEIRTFDVPKRNGGTRRIGALQPIDLLVQKFLLRILTPSIDRAFSSAAVGFRKGYSRETARKMIYEALRDGCSYIMETDIADFFDEVDWNILFSELSTLLPRADVATFRLLRESVTATVIINGKRISRVKGLVQGSPLSPLLSNVYLRNFDEGLLREGFRLIRYADDLLIPARSEEEARNALEAVKAHLAPLNLAVNEEKTLLAGCEGCRFLGMHIDLEEDHSDIMEAALKQPLFVQQPYAFVGIDGASVIVRKHEDLLGRIPLHRISEIFLFGAGAVSARLLQVCSREKVPVSFCTPSGWYIGTFRPNSRQWFKHVSDHAARHAALSPSKVLRIAAALIRAKIQTTAQWLLPRLERKENIAHQRDQSLQAMDEAQTIPQLMGVEGNFSRHTFSEVNGLVRVREFFAPRRVPRAKPDRWNTLLDTLYSLLFTRLNVLIRGQGLNPYLGFLHSAYDRYESLVADLQEPFRARMDQMAVRLVNQGIVQPEHIIFQGERWRLEKVGFSIIFEAFEREMDTRRRGEQETLRGVLTTQIAIVQAWACHDAPLRIYNSACPHLWMLS